MRYNIAILYNFKEKLAPSNLDFLSRFQRVANNMNISAQIIEAKDYPLLAIFDALFIRETTYMYHHTALFAKKAALEGMPVIDDIASIMLCNNKVYLSELFAKFNIPHPLTKIFTSRTLHIVPDYIKYPIILKMPDSEFSRGAFKAETYQQFQNLANDMFKKSNVLAAQEYMPTDFDWRIGVLNGKPLFACKYFMAPNHWQIYKHNGNGSGTFIDGDSETVAVEDVPQDIIQLALDSSALIGNGLYGVDIKSTDTGNYVMEINDNPNIEANVEDLKEGDKLYKTLIQYFIDKSQQTKTKPHNHL